MQLSQPGGPAAILEWRTGTLDCDSTAQHSTFGERPGLGSSDVETTCTRTAEVVGVHLQFRTWFIPAGIWIMEPRWLLLLLLLLLLYFSALRLVSEILPPVLVYQSSREPLPNSIA